MADAEYNIDIAAKLSDDAASQGLEDLALQLAGINKHTRTWADAQAAATKALGLAQAEYRALEREALKAAKAEERASARGLDTTEHALALGKANAALAEQARKLAEVERIAGQVAGTERRLTNEHRALATEASRLGKLNAVLGSAGPLGQFAARGLDAQKRFIELRSSVGLANATVALAAGAFAVAAAAITGLAIAAGAGAVALFRFGVAQRDAARTAGLATEAAEFFTPELAGVRTEIDALSKAYGLSGAQLQGFGKQLTDVGVRGADLASALEAAAIAETARSGGASEFVAQIQKGERSVRDLAAAAKAQLGDVATKQLIGLGKQSERLQRVLAGLFSGLELDPLLAGFSTLVGMFDRGTALGDTLAWVFERLFQPVIDYAPKAAIAIERFFLDSAIWALEFYLGARDAIRATREWLGIDDSTLAMMLRDLAAAGELAKGALTALAYVAGGALAVALAGVATFAAAVSAPLIGLVALFTETGRSMIAGMIRGIWEGAKQLAGAVADVALQGYDAAKRALGIHSPSRLFAELGEYSAAGFADGAEDGAPNVADAFSRMSTVAADSAAGVASSGTSNSTTNNGPRIGNITVNVTGVPDAPAVGEAVREELLAIFEGDALSVGA